ncbi:MAG: iron-sulfur cluster assembly protein [Thermodesulfobacteriota bacterium]
MDRTADLGRRVMEALARVIDPKTGLSVLRMEISHNLEVTDKREVLLVFRPSSTACPMAYCLADSIKRTAEAVEGVSWVGIKVENFNRAHHLESLLNPQFPQTTTAEDGHNHTWKSAPRISGRWHMGRTTQCSRSFRKGIRRTTLFQKAAGSRNQIRVDFPRPAWRPRAGRVGSTQAKEATLLTPRAAELKISSRKEKESNLISKRGSSG